MSDKIVDLTLRRAQERKKRGEPSKDPVIRAAEKITLLYGELAGEISTVNLLAAIALSRRALMVMLRTSVGAHAARIEQEGTALADAYNMHEPRHYRGPTVFDEHEEDE